MKRTLWHRVVDLFACRPRATYLSAEVDEENFDDLHLTEDQIPTARAQKYAKSARLPRVHARKAKPEVSFGEMDAYPLVQPSIMCKATGGGRWEPKPDAWDAFKGSDNEESVDEEPIEEDTEEWGGDGTDVGEQGGTWIVDGPFQYRLNQSSSWRSQMR